MWALHTGLVLCGPSLEFAKDEMRAAFAFQSVEVANVIKAGLTAWNLGISPDS